MKWFKIVIDKFGQFEGRARRKEFWMFFLMLLRSSQLWNILVRNRNANTIIITITVQMMLGLYVVQISIIMLQVRLCYTHN